MINPQTKTIAKSLGVTPGTLPALLSIRAGRSAMNRGSYLIEQGFAFYASGWKLTEAGEAMVARARALGL